VLIIIVVAGISMTLKLSRLQAEFGKLKSRAYVAIAVLLSMRKLGGIQYCVE
jgi:hypothetical protein